MRTGFGMWMVLLSFWFGLAARASGQSMKPGCDESGTPVKGVIRDQPFSALSYVRTFAVEADGTRRFLRNERYPIRIARNAVGCLRMDYVENPQDACARLDVLEPAPCIDRPVAVFDLTHAVVTHWSEGERGYPGPVVIRLTPSQVEDAKLDTSAMQVPPTATSSDEQDLRVEVLGEKVIEGLRVIGVRETRTVRVSDSRPPAQTIHEVWVSPELKVVVQVIDGNPRKQLIIAGLDHVHRQVDDSFFQPVPGYRAAFYSQDTRDLAKEDIRYLSFWFVQSFDSGE